MLKLLKSRKGVTLVELLAVVVILGIIAAIAVPTIGGLIERQEERAAESTLISIEEAAKLYAEDSEPFTLATLESGNFIDLKDNQFGWDADDDLDASLIWIVVTGNTVSFYQDADVNDAVSPIVLNVGAAADDLFINSYNVSE
jgi:type IV pilus assembly protein PilA